jgi:ABC-type phosphate/phosphonate transport system permease subunit
LPPVLPTTAIRIVILVAVSIVDGLSGILRRRFQ